MRRRRDPPRFLEYERRAGGAPSELDLVAHHGKRKSLLHLLHPLGLEVVVPQHFLCTEQVLYLQSPDLREPRMVAPVRERHVEEKKVRLFVDEGAEMVEDDFLARERCRHIDGAPAPAAHQDHPAIQPKEVATVHGDLLSEERIGGELAVEPRGAPHAVAASIARTEGRAGDQPVEAILQKPLQGELDAVVAAGAAVDEAFVEGKVLLEVDHREGAVYDYGYIEQMLRVQLELQSMHIAQALVVS